MMGRPPIPTKRKMAEGDRAAIGVNKLNAKLASEPQAEEHLPPCEPRLKGRVAALYAFYSEELEKMQLSYRPDVGTLQGLCVAQARAELADDLVESEGLVVKSPVMSSKDEFLGYAEKVNPAIKISQDQWRLFEKFLSHLGLSPASRTRLTIERKADQDGEAQVSFAKWQQARATQ